VEIVFLYNRLYSISKNQLEAIKSGQFELMEELTIQREKLTGKICSIMEYKEGKIGNGVVNRKVLELTELVLNVDEDIKEVLMKELMTKTLEINNLQLVED